MKLITGTIVRVVAGIIIGVVIALSVTTVQAQYVYDRFSRVKTEDNFISVFWDDVEKTNCYVFIGLSDGGISCVRSMNY